MMNKLEDSRRHRILMCAPQFFDVEYEINPWMKGNLHTTKADIARKQWHDLHVILSERADISLVTPERGVPDLVFTANAGLILDNTAVLSHFRHPERQKEEPYFKSWFEGRGFDVIEMPDDIAFEGAGDALFLRESGMLVMGHGFRTDRETVDFLEERLDVDVLPMKLVDPRFYHLDTCFCPLRGGKVIYYPAAFDQESVHAFEQAVAAEDRYAVSDQDAQYFSCNAVDTGDAVVLNNATPELKAKLTEWGFDVITTPLTEFLLAGGAAKCLTLRLDEPRDDSYRKASLSVEQMA